MLELDVEDYAVTLTGMRMKTLAKVFCLVVDCAVLNFAVAKGACPEPSLRMGFDDERGMGCYSSGGTCAALSMTGTVAFDPMGIRGGCAFFDGRSWLSAPKVPAGIPRGTDAYTVCAWIRVAEGCSPHGGWVSWGDMATGKGNSLRLEGNDAIHNYWNNRDLTVVASGVGDGRWHHVVATAGSGRRCVYMDGLMLGDDGLSPNAGQGIFLVGKTMHDAPFTGWIDELKVWRRTFSADEVFQLYKDELTRPALARKEDLPRPAISSRPIDASADRVLCDGFTIDLKVDFDQVTGDEPLYEVGPVRLALRQAGRNPAFQAYDAACGNYLCFPMPDGTCPVIEATIAAKAGRVGIPLAVLAQPRGVHEVTLQFSPVKWAIVVDGCHVDEDFPIPSCPVRWPDRAFERRLSTRVRSSTFISPAKRGVVPEVAAPRAVTRSIQYWTPEGHNRWVGDVAPAYLNGKLHVFYLIDRRHHRSGAGTGRHQFAHLMTEDLVHWTELPLAVSVREPWQTVGTGTPFLKDGKLAIAFGWHTSRYPGMQDKPLGGTYASSADGIHFENSGVMISEAQNPSVYNLSDRCYELVTSYGGSIGIYRSRDLHDWELFDARLPFRGDCPSLFSWKGHRYLLQGFVNMAYSVDGTPGSFVDWSRAPDKLYEGLSVPMVTSWKDDRRLYFGWLNHLHGWGGWLVVREVVYYPDGHLGLKWVPEIVPPVPPCTYRVRQGERFERRFRPQDGGPELVLAVDPAARTASFADAVPEVRFGEAKDGHNVRIGGVRGLEGDYEVRVIVYYDAKSHATIFDAEIAGQRTLICRRPGRFVSLKP